MLKFVDMPKLGPLIASMHNVAIEPEWTHQDPTEPGVYRWRKNWQWEPVTREIRKREDGVLVTYAHRYEQWLPLNRVLGEWLIADLVANGCINPASKCVARKDIFRK